MVPKLKLPDKTSIPLDPATIYRPYIDVIYLETLFFISKLFLHLLHFGSRLIDRSVAVVFLIPS